jgi:pimeloyl-ACP methyl ester carboxylesterase
MTAAARMGTVKRVVRLAAALLVIVAAAPASASARPLEPCERDSIVHCGSIDVPLDRSGRVPGDVPLYVEHAQVTTTTSRRHRDQPNGAIFALAGGPGQPATQFTTDFLFAFSILGGDPDVPRDVVTFDQRGTGESGLLRCPDLEKVVLLSRFPEAAERCATRLGDRRGLYTTSASVDDLEAVRQAIGADKIVIYGASYGTKVALLYAARYPEHVERLILDSVVTPEGPDPLYRDTFAAMTRVTRASCATRCGWTVDPAADLSALAIQLGGGPARGFVVDRRGRPLAQALGSTRLFFLMMAGDFAPRIRAALPAATYNARRGDPAPLLRLASISESGNEPTSPRDFSVAVFAATICEEAALPWQRGAPFDDRERQAADAIAALGDSAFAPLGSGAAARTDLIQLCRRWAEAGPAPAAAGPLPDVPALLLSGELDLRTPLEGAQRVAAAMPHSTLLRIPATGHSTLGSDTSSCTLDSITRFLARRSVRSTCARPAKLQPPESPAPLSLDEVKPATRQVPEPVGRAIAALDLTLDDVEDQVATQAVLSFSSADDGAVRGGGLRAGRFRAGNQGVSLDRVVYVPGLTVSGRLLDRAGRIGSFRLSGSRAVAGRLDYHGGGIVTGRIGGREFRFKLRRAVLPPPEIQLGKLAQPVWPRPKFG